MEIIYLKKDLAKLRAEMSDNVAKVGERLDKIEAWMDRVEDFIVAFEGGAKLVRDLNPKKVERTKRGKK